MLILRDNQDMGIEERLMLLSVKASLGISKEEKPIEALLSSHAVDWPRFKGFLAYHETAPCVYAGLKEHARLIPVEVTRFLKTNYTYNTYRNAHLLREFLLLNEGFKREGVLMTPVKGMSFLNDIYGDLSLRPMTDIDILVEKKDVRKAEIILERLGYRKELLGLKEEYWRERQYHVTFFKDKHAAFPVMLELHWALDYERSNEISLPIWSRLREKESEGQRVYLLSPEDTLFCLALHNRRFGKALCLKNVIDLALLLKKYKTFDWDYVLRQARQNSMVTTVYFILTQAETFLDFAAPRSFITVLGVPAWKKKAIRTFINKNTFSARLEKDFKGVFLQSHFLLYDRLLEPAGYILKIPCEQFAKFYGLEPYDRKTRLFYNWRLCYMPFRLVFRRKDDII